MIPAAVMAPAIYPAIDWGHIARCAIPPFPAICAAKDAAKAAGVSPGNVAAGAAGDVLGGIAHAFSTAAGDFLKSAMGLYLQVGTPNMDSGSASQPSAFGNLQSHLFFLCSLLAVGAILWQAGKMAINRDGRPLAGVIRGLFVIILVFGILAAVTKLAGTFADQFSAWIIDESTHGQFNARIGTITAGMGVVAAPGALTLAMLVLLTSVGLVGLAVVRGILIFLYVGAFIPLAASTSMTDGGWSKTKQLIGTLAAWVLFKPVAAIIIAAGYWLVGSGQSLLDVISGVSLIVLSAFAIIPLVKLMSPLPHARGADGTVGAGMGVAAAGLAAQGAKHVSAEKSTNYEKSSVSHSAMTKSQVPQGSVSAPQGAWSIKGGATTPPGGHGGGVSLAKSGASAPSAAVQGAVILTKTAKNAPGGAVGKVGK
jgi:hypothetical protein